MPAYTDVLSVFKPIVKGSAEIRIDTPDKFERMMGALHGMPLYQESYVRLLVNGELVMTDAEFERRTNYGFICNAQGDILIAGLGIGLILGPALEKGKSVTVVEINQDVISLVAPAFPHSKLRIIHEDIYKWKPAKGQMFDTIYFDIWADFSEDTNAEAAKLRRKFSKYLRDGGWMESWSQAAMRARGRR